MIRIINVTGKFEIETAEPNSAIVGRSNDRLIVVGQIFVGSFLCFPYKVVEIDRDRRPHVLGQYSNLRWTIMQSFMTRKKLKWVVVLDDSDRAENAWLTLDEFGMAASEPKTIDNLTLTGLYDTV